MSINILFLTTAVEHATFRKTARMIGRSGADVEMMGFTRHNYPASKDGLATTTLGVVNHKRYISRLSLLWKYYFLFRRKARASDVLYCFGLDSLVIAYILMPLSSIRKVYQVQDIRSQLIGSAAKARFLRTVESYLVKKVDLLVVSSPAYYESHFKRYYGLPKEKVFVLENKLEAKPQVACDAADADEGKSGPIKIGYFGVIRCATSLSILTDLVKQENRNIELHLRGKVTAAQWETSCHNSKNVYFNGPYRAPDDLDDMYRNVDVVWAAYPFGHKKEGNWQWARTVRFYESCAYGVPVIVQKGTVDEQFVKEHEVGLVVDMSDPDSVRDQLGKLNKNQIKTWSENLKKLPSSFFVYDGEHQRIVRCLESKIAKIGSYAEVDCE